MKRIKIALLSSVFIFPGAVALAQDDRGVTKADPTYSDDTIEANVDGQDVIETPEGEARATMDEPVVVEEGMDTGTAQRVTEDDRGVTKADPTYSDDTVEANVDGQDVIETPGG
jgi:hypothetical protein